MLYKFDYKTRVEDNDMIPMSYIKNKASREFADKLLERVNFTETEENGCRHVQGSVVVLHHTQVKTLEKYLDLIASHSPELATVAGEIKREIVDM